MKILDADIAIGDQARELALLLGMELTKLQRWSPGSFLRTAMASTGASADGGMWLTASAKRNDKVLYSLEMSRNSRD